MLLDDKNDPLLSAMENHHMTLCEEIMRKPAVSISSDATVRETIDFIMKPGHHGFAFVVDNKDHTVGEVDIPHLMGLLLPRSLNTVHGVTNPKFIRESLEDLKERLESYAQHPIINFLKPDMCVLRVDDPVISAVSNLHANHLGIGVVEDFKNKKLVGTVSIFSIMKTLGKV